MKQNSLNIVLTGGGSGIGAAIAQALSAEDHRVFICGRRKNRLEEIAQTHEGISYCVCDVSDEQSVVRFVDYVQHHVSYLDVLINCAGVFGEVNRFDKTDSQRWKQTFEINTFGTYLVTKHFLPLLLQSTTKKIINFSGGGAFNAFPQYSAYAVSKAAVVRLSENMAEELKDVGVTVNCIAPGFVATELHEATLKAGKKRAGKQYDITIQKLHEGHVPITTPVECIQFFISEKSNGLTGKTISANFDSWNTDDFINAIAELNNSALYTSRRINLVDLPPEDPLRKQLMKVQKRG